MGRDVTLERVSVLSVTHAGESPENLEMYFRSLAWQTRPADEIILVLDGQLGRQLDAVAEYWADRLPLTVIRKDKAGLAAGLNEGLRHCHHEYVIRCDTDDTSRPGRFETLVETLAVTGASVVSGPICENWSGGQRRTRAIPSGDVNNFTLGSFFRSPVNHNNCCYRKSDVLSAGGYPSGRMEDFRLWSTMLAAGCRFYNVVEVLLDADARNLNLRRGGVAYAQAEWALLKVNFRRLPPLGAVLACVAFVLRVALRSEWMVSLRGQLYRTVLRRQNGPGL